MHKLKSALSLQDAFCLGWGGMWEATQFGILPDHFWFFILNTKPSLWRENFWLYLTILSWCFLSISWNKSCFTTYVIFLYFTRSDFRKWVMRRRLEKGTLIFLERQEQQCAGGNRTLTPTPMIRKSLPSLCTIIKVFRSLQVNREWPSLQEYTHHCLYQFLKGRTPWHSSFVDCLCSLRGKHNFNVPFL